MSTLIGYVFCFCFIVTVTKSDPVVYNTTVAATNIESTIGTPAILVDPTTYANQNTTDNQYEVSFEARKKISSFRGNVFFKMNSTFEYVRFADNSKNNPIFKCHK